LFLNDPDDLQVYNHLDDEFFVGHDTRQRRDRYRRHNPSCVGPIDSRQIAGTTSCRRRTRDASITEQNI
jgi:hypothetical protein